MDDLNTAGVSSDFLNTRRNKNNKVLVSKEEIEAMKNILDNVYLMSNNEFELTANTIKEKLTELLESLVPVDLLAYSMEIKKILAIHEENALKLLQEGKFRG